MGRIEAVCISEKKGTPKKDVGEAVFIRDQGAEHDAHAGSERQVSLLSYEKVRSFESEFNKDKEGSEVLDIPAGAFGENLLVSGIKVEELPLGTILCCGEVMLEVMQIGKKCHDGCTITRTTGKCIMPKSGVFARVIRGGIIKNKDEISIKR
ncbi:MAG: MOSC domain-containing protein [Lachnospiraceae bacterium]|nr:MOSC domain-containing protein [Lachnospiraceae bacterium]